MRRLNGSGSFVPQRERLEKHCERSATSCLQLESMLLPSVSSFVFVVICFVSDEDAAHRARLTGVVASASNSLKLELQSSMELLGAAK